MVERFAKERARETKGSKFQLGGEDEDGDDLLTHGGKALRLGLLFVLLSDKCWAVQISIILES